GAILSTHNIIETSDVFKRCNPAKTFALGGVINCIPAVRTGSVIIQPTHQGVLTVNDLLGVELSSDLEVVKDCESVGVAVTTNATGVQGFASLQVGPRYLAITVLSISLYAVWCFLFR
ncbi:MAG: hypothetical protein EBY36_03925, partial [Gammaproteobacteria bacterium]|nr:hypothetical protein [Gammaproteobacteria bacterium]